MYIYVLLVFMPSCTATENSTNTGAPLYLQNVIPGDFITHDQVIHSAAPPGTLLGVFVCSGGVAEPNITVTRTHTLTSDVSGRDNISFDIAQDHIVGTVYYLLVNRIATSAHQYYLVSCSDGFSVLSERIGYQTIGTLENNIQPYFRSIKSRYTVGVDLQGGDVEAFEVEAVVGLSWVVHASCRHKLFMHCMSSKYYYNLAATLVFQNSVLIYKLSLNEF